TATGQYSTSESVLEKIEHPLAEIILEHRGLAKLKSTYTDRLVEQSHNDTHRVHRSYHQALTATGRLSSSDPNLQNIPIRRQIGRQIRKAFIAPE
ncbi:DNA polymerase, partial [Acinetobacter baumannii]